MLSHSAVLTVLLLGAMQAGAASLQGIIHENESGGPPMANVGVTGDGANPTTTESFGRFTLDFPKKNPGDPTQIIVIKAGYVVVNDVQLTLALPSHPEYQVLSILLCKDVDADEMRRRFYRIKSTAAIEDTYTQRRKELEAHGQATAKAIAKLENERDQAKAAAGRTFEFLAEKAPGQNSELSEQAQRLFLDGDVDRAIELLNDDALNLALANDVERRNRGEQPTGNGTQAWLLKSKLLTVKYRFDDAAKDYLKVLEAIPGNFAPNLEFALFNQGLNRYDEARLSYQRCIDIAKKLGSDPFLAISLNNLGNLARAEGRTKEAKQRYEEALKINRELAKKTPDIFLPDVATTLVNLGNLSRDQNRIDEARRHYEEALQIYESPAIEKKRGAQFIREAADMEYQLETLSKKGS